MVKRITKQKNGGIQFRLFSTKCHEVSLVWEPKTFGLKRVDYFMGPFAFLVGPVYFVVFATDMF